MVSFRTIQILFCSFGELRSVIVAFLGYPLTYYLILKEEIPKEARFVIPSRDTTEPVQTFSR